MCGYFDYFSNAQVACHCTERRSFSRGNASVFETYYRRRVQKFAVNKKVLRIEQSKNDVVSEKICGNRLVGRKNEWRNHRNCMFLA